jgi:hypothetical protein
MRRVMALTMVALLFESACSDPAQTRIAVMSDTLIINGPRTVTIPAHVVRSDGGTVSNARLTYSSNSEVVRLSNDGHVACAHAGDAAVVISQRTLETRLVVLCRPILSFGLSGGISPLWVGGPPVTITMTAFDSAGKPVGPLRGTVQIRDDSIARIINGRVYALARGHTRVDMDFAGVATGLPIKVVERAVHDSVHLVGGELESWRVSPGYYEVQLATSSHNGDSTGLELGAFHASCARAPVNRGQHYFCVLRKGASFIVRNSKPVGPRSTLDGELIVFRQP